MQVQALNDKSSKIALAIDALTLKKLAFKEKGAIWLDTSESGDDKNRVLIREDGRPTYFASDVAYHKDKIDAVIGLSVPFTRRGKISSIELWKNLYKDIVRIANMPPSFIKSHF